MTSLETRSSSYVTSPAISLPGGSRILTGSQIWVSLARIANQRSTAQPMIVIDAYPGVETREIAESAQQHLPGWNVIDVEEAALSATAIDAMIARNLTDDRVFGVMSHFELAEFYDQEALERIATTVASTTTPTIVIGWGAALVPADRAVVVLADLARWEIQKRQRAGAGNWRTNNGAEDILKKYKRGYFVEWRTADRHKRDLFDRLDYLLDTNRGISESAMIDGDSFRTAMSDASSRPFRVVPFFDPGVWGGQWMKSRLGLDPTPDNYAWCFDCVPEENSLLLEADGMVIEVPAMDLVLMKPRELLGEKTFARFGAEFPIRFDFLDTMGGGNLSLQVHPLTDYINDKFGMSYTQDESYYLLDCEDDAVVYLGLKTGTDPSALMTSLRTAATGLAPFKADEFINAIPAKKHDHFSIPAGTVHCSGANSMVLEISATPYIFTFKLWDWGRLGLDGIPRPIHLDHGIANIQWNRDTKWVQNNLLGQVEVLGQTGDTREERTGLHELEFIETRRHWFTGTVHHDTEGTVNVLNLVEGDEVEVFSPTEAFEPYTIHYAETFIVPASVGAYGIRPTAGAASTQFATLKAYVRDTTTTVTR
ncbi:mannose-6-phosphate isomerase class I [Cryobacterium sp. MP_M5]|uniref:class I mannose-6-phosphate isomerase n=1 Tax=unclassified Cryobacterium TaxID=2649013 RepID=UPI0018C92A60|nr:MULTISPECIES: class I mannose-6-phosphate isomerase [unclassified Cryobacterium]MBG6057210.1 mannose-6-phosphate isomerase class I [Cryobacterium sp. MP_M3]MEC5175409.1 mannose-6-phosphate isomerase class I [Cryobacterium sp. MP_M5]